MATALAPFLRFEARLALSPRHAAVFALGVAILVVDSLLFPVMPSLVNDFMIRAFHLSSLTDVVLLNDYMAIYMVLYLAGAFGLIRVFIGPAEEGELDLYLTKPVTRTQYILARALPTLGLVAAGGAGLTVTTVAVVAAFQGALDPAPVVAAGAILTAVVLALLALLNLVYLYLREVDHAILVAFVVGIAPLLPGSVFLYRPDVIADPRVAALIVLPANLLWAPARLPAVAAAVSAAALALGALLVALAARRLTRHPGL